MVKKMLVYLLLLYSILCQGIIATLSDDDIQESSALLSREKRVVNLVSAEHQPIRIEDANYMTIIKESGRPKCVGVILSHYTVITAATCVTNDKSRYSNFCGSSRGFLCAPRNITLIVTNYGSNNPHNYADGIALLTVDPPFTFGPKTGSIQLYKGPLREGTQVTVSGWGCHKTLTHLKGVYQRLRQITIPLMNHGECQNVYRNHFRVSNKHICTYDEHKYCARADIGSPLVVDNMLAGIHIFKGELRNQINPDVFIDLQLTEYSQWISENVRLI